MFIFATFVNGCKEVSLVYITKKDEIEKGRHFYLVSEIEEGFTQDTVLQAGKHQGIAMRHVFTVLVSLSQVTHYLYLYLYLYFYLYLHLFFCICELSGIAMWHVCTVLAFSQSLPPIIHIYICICICFCICKVYRQCHMCVQC